MSAGVDQSVDDVQPAPSENVAESHAPGSEQDEGSESDGSSLSTDLSEEDEEHPDQMLRRAITDNDLERVKAAIELGGNPNRRYITHPIFDFAESYTVIKFLHERGAKVGLLKNMEASRRLLLGLEGLSLNSSNAGDGNSEDRPPHPLDAITKGQFDEGRERRFGASNPEKMDIPFWNAMVECGGWAWDARERFVNTGRDQRSDEDKKDDKLGAPELSAGEGDSRPLEDDGDDKTQADDGLSDEARDFWKHPIWCTAREGQSITVLPDGRTVEIGGEHEDYYDPDYLVYNDVIVHEPDFTDAGAAGQSMKKFTIYGYPKDVFPPTDAHTATFVSSLNAIIIIGNTGFGNEETHESKRRGETPVYMLDVHNWEITKIESTGERPGWIYNHEAALEGGGIRIRGRKEDGWSDIFATKRTVVLPSEDGKMAHEHPPVGWNETWVLSLKDWSWEKEIVSDVPSTWEEVRSKHRKNKNENNKGDDAAAGSSVA